MFPTDRFRRVGATAEEIRALSERAIDHASLDEQALRDILAAHRDADITHEDVVKGIAEKLAAGIKKK